MERIVRKQLICSVLVALLIAAGWLAGSRQPAQAQFGTSGEWRMFSQNVGGASTAGGPVWIYHSGSGEVLHVNPTRLRQVPLQPTTN